MKTYIHLIASRSMLLRKRNVLDKSCRDIKNTEFMIEYFLFNRAVYEILWKNIVETGWQHPTLWRMRIACWIPKATNTPSEYVILLAFPLQKWLYQRA